MLRGLGWNTMAVYLLDWLDNREKVLGKIEENLDHSARPFGMNGLMK